MELENQKKAGGAGFFLFQGSGSLLLLFSKREASAVAEEENHQGRLPGRKRVFSYKGSLGWAKGEGSWRWGMGFSPLSVFGQRKGLWLAAQGKSLRFLGFSFFKLSFLFFIPLPVNKFFSPV